MRLPPLSAPTVVYVVRHAEKAAGQGLRDVPLSSRGEARAASLPGQLELERLAAVVVTPYLRTRQTAAAVLRATGLEPRIVPANDISAAVFTVAEHPGRAVLIVGHCDTVPHILEGLGVQAQVSLSLADYGDLFEVRLDGAEVRMLRRQFG